VNIIGVPLKLTIILLGDKLIRMLHYNSSQEKWGQTLLGQSGIFKQKKMNSKKVILMLMLWFVFFKSNAQTILGNSNPLPTAAFEMQSNSKGFLVPRMSYAQMQAIVSPATGLQVWCTNCGINIGAMEYYNGSAWIAFDGTSVSTVYPTIAATTTVSNISFFSATSGGNITSDNGQSIVQKGVCWSTSTNPTISLSSKTTEGSGAGSFTSDINSLLDTTQYYVRSYATNNLGVTVYGAETFFLTKKLAINAIGLGGKVAYILTATDPGYDANVKHGIIVALADNAAIEWGPNNILTGANAITFGAGLNNSNLILNTVTTGPYAAIVARQSTLNGYTDWYLPSVAELQKIAISKTLLGYIGDYYWTSSELNMTHATRINLYNNEVQWSQPKSNNHRCRFARNF
jgi:hypothetical protein